MPLYAAVGGFPLAGASIQQIIPDTVRDLAQLDLRWRIPSSELDAPRLRRKADDRGR